MRLDHATLKCSPQSLCRVSSCWKKGGRQAPQPRQGELIVKPWCKIELHFHDPQTGHGYVALSSLELGTEPNGRACMRQDFHISSRTPRDLKRCQAQALNSKQHCRVIDHRLLGCQQLVQTSPGTDSQPTNGACWADLSKARLMTETYALAGTVTSERQDAEPWGHMLRQDIAECSHFSSQTMAL